MRQTASRHLHGQQGTNDCVTNERGIVFCVKGKRCDEPMKGSVSVPPYSNDTCHLGRRGSQHVLKFRLYSQYRYMTACTGLDSGCLQGSGEDQCCQRGAYAQPPCSKSSAHPRCDRGTGRQQHSTRRYYSDGGSRYGHTRFERKRIFFDGMG